MVKTSVCVAALLFQLLLPTLSFIQKNTTTARPPATIAGFLFKISMFNILMDFNFIPVRYRLTLIPSGFLDFLEFLLSILLMEFGSVKIWTQIEKTIYKFFTCILMDNDFKLYESMGGDALPSTVTVMFSILLFVITMKLSGQVPALLCRYRQIEEAIHRAWDQRND